MTRKLVLVTSIGTIIAAAACGGGDKDQRTMEAAMDSMTRPRDSAVRSLDSSANPGQPVDTKKLGAAKTESILTKARKAP
jgi:hypothetical protein